MSTASAIGVDVGGTHLRAAVVDSGGNVLRSQRQAIGARDPEGLLGEVAEQVAPLDDDTDLPMGVGLAALIRSDGTVAVAPNLGWCGVAFGDMLRARFGRPVRLVNDLNAITVGEARAGAGRGSRHVVCIFLGTGLGMGAVVHGQLVEGAGGVATELGHIQIESPDDGRLCGCGQRGCLEAYVSGAHLPQLVTEANAETRLIDDVAGDLSALTADRIEAAAVDGDPRATVLWDQIADRLGRAAANVVTVLNPEVLILGGGVLTAAPSLRRRTTERIGIYAPAYHVDTLRIERTALGDDAGVVGAALLALEATR